MPRNPPKKRRGVTKRDHDDVSRKPDVGIQHSTQHLESIAPSSCEFWAINKVTNPLQKRTRSRFRSYRTFEKQAEQNRSPPNKNRRAVHRLVTGGRPCNTSLWQAQPCEGKMQTVRRITAVLPSVFGHLSQETRAKRKTIKCNTIACRNGCAWLKKTPTQTFHLAGGSSFPGTRDIPE